MPLKSAVTDINTVDEADRKHYVERDGVYVLDAEASEVVVNGATRQFGIDDIGTMKATISRQQADIANLRTASQAFEGLDASKVKSQLAELDTLRNENASIDEKVNSMAQSKIDQMAGVFRETETELNQRIQVAESALERQLITSQIQQEIIAAKGDENTVRLLTPHLAERVRMKREGDRYGYEVIDKVTGGPAVGDANGSPMSIKQLVEQARNDATFAVAFPSSGRSGGGTNQSGTGGSQFPGKKSQFSSAQRSSYLKKHGWESWLKLPK